LRCRSQENGIFKGFRSATSLGPENCFLIRLRLGWIVPGRELFRTPPASGQAQPSCGSVQTLLKDLPSKKLSSKKLAPNANSGEIEAQWLIADEVLGGCFRPM
jgi:hypothetical protein